MTAASAQVVDPETARLRARELNQLGCVQEFGGQSARARDYFEMAAPAWPAARFNLGVMLALGRGGDAQPRRSQSLIESVWAETTLPQAGAWLLETALERRDDNAAQALVPRLEALAHPRADLMLARLAFAQGRHERALGLLTRAAQAGQPTAVRLLAVLSRPGTGLPRDAMEAASWQLIADAMLRPGGATDSALLAGVKNSLQANDWSPGGALAAEGALACDVAASTTAAAGAAPPTTVPVAPAAAAAAAVAVAQPVPAAAPALPARPPAVAPVATAAPSFSAATPPAAAPAAPAAGLPAGTAAAQAAGTPAPSTPALPPFVVGRGQSVRAAWLAYGRPAGATTLWAAPDLAAGGDIRLVPDSLQSLGELIVASAEALGLAFKLQIQEDERGAVQALRIAPR